MGYKRKTYKTYKRKTYKNKSWYDTTSVGDVARKALAGVGYLKSLINVERKLKDTDFSSTNITNTGTITQLTNIAEGLTNITRTGQVVKANTDSYNFIINQHASATTSHVRLILFWEKDDNENSDPSVEDVLQTASTTSFLDYDRTGRFCILFDKLYILESVVKHHYTIRGTVKLNHHIRWNSGNGDDTAQGHVYLLMISSESENYPTITGTNRLRYIDN